ARVRSWPSRSTYFTSFISSCRPSNPENDSNDQTYARCDNDGSQRLPTAEPLNLFVAASRGLVHSISKLVDYDLRLCSCLAQSPHRFASGVKDLLRAARLD